MCEHSHKHDEKLPITRIAAAAVIFSIALIFQLNGFSKFLIFFIVYLTAGGDVILKAFKHILKGSVFDENFLMSLATLGAFAIGEYPEAVMVMLLYQIGEMLQDHAVEKSKQSISELMDIRPDYANVEINGELIKKNPEEAKIGDIIKVKTGEKIPLDGIVTGGEALVDTSALTGEAVPRNLKTGDKAVSGCINTNGVLTIRVEKEFDASTVSKILELVEHAGSKKAKAENFITKFARYYTPVVVLGALILAFVPPLFTNGRFIVWFERALTFLVISCPCALVISVPLSFFAGIGGASKEGILIKGACYIEALSKPSAVVFDKTGTLTKGTFKVTEIHPENGISKEEVLEYAAYAENYSSHPIANSIKSAFGEKIDKNRIKHIEEIAGNGIKADIEGAEILVGNKKLMEKFEIKYKNTNGTVVYVAKNGKYLGFIIISDEIKEDSAQTISDLKKLKIQTIMLTGDNSNAAGNIAEKLSLDRVYSELLPEQKVEKLEEIITTASKSVIFAGDGINDAPVLTRADAGIAMGGLGSDAAIEAADVIIMDDKPSKIVKSILISKKTMSIVKENIVFALGVKILFLILGTFGLITMWGAVFADVGVTLIAIINSLRGVYTAQIK